MATTQEEQNTYLEYVKEEFLKTVKEKEELAKNYSADKEDEYQNVRSQLAYCASELIKSGIKCVNDRNATVGIVIDGVVYDVSKDEIKDEAGEARYAILMKQSEENDVSIEALFGDTTPVRKDESFDLRDLQSDLAENENKNPITMLTEALQQMFANGNNTNVPAPAEIFKAPAEEKDELQSVLDDVNSVQKKIFLLNQEKDNKINEVAELKQTIEILKQELSDREEQYSQETLSYEENIFNLKESKDEVETQLVKEMDKTQEQGNKINSLEQKIKSLEDQVKSKTEEIASLEKTNAELQKSLSSLQSKIDHMHDEAVKKDAVTEVEVKNAKESVKTAEERARAAEEEKSKVAGECEHLRKELQEMKDKQDKAIEKLKKDHSAELDKVKSAASKDSGAKEELAKLRTDYDKLLSEKNTIASELATTNVKITELESMKNSYDNLTKLAYTDVKTELKNNNAFNADFKNTNHESVILSLIDIRNMREINAQHGKLAGDKVISTVAHAIIDYFPKDTVYRISGDEFAVINMNTTLNQVQGNLVDLYNKLLNTESIEIAHGCAVGNNFSKHRELIDAAENEVNAMKRTSGQGIYDRFKDQVVSEDTKAPEVSDLSGEEPEELDLELEELMMGDSDKKSRNDKER